MGHDVGLRVVALDPELLLQLLEEAQLDVDLLVGGAVERTDLGSAGPHPVFVRLEKNASSGGK